MKVVVCVKHVPDGQGDRRIEEGRIVRGEDDTLNELDEYAIEAAVQLVEKFGGEVVAVTMGPEDAEEAIQRALQMGADSGLHINDEQLAGVDAMSTAAVLTAAIHHLSIESPVDLVILGMASLDGMTSLVPPAIATNLNWPFLGLANSIETIGEAPEGLRIVRHADGWEDTCQAPLPLVLSVTDQVNEPRYPSFKSMKAARSKPVEEVEWDQLSAHVSDLPHADLRPRAMVLEAAPIERQGNPEILQDTGDGGTKLAQYLFDQIK